MRKDKHQVIGEDMPDKDIYQLLLTEPTNGDSPGFHKLMRAYQSLRVQDFERFLTYYKDEGYKIEAEDAQGLTLETRLESNLMAQPYLALMHR